MGGAQEDGEGRVMEAKQFLRNIPDMRPEGWGGAAEHAEHSAPDWKLRERPGAGPDRRVDS